jgi:hypothetical protein
MVAGLQRGFAEGLKIIHAFCYHALLRTALNLQRGFAEGL